MLTEHWKTKQRNQMGSSWMRWSGGSLAEESQILDSLPTRAPHWQQGPRRWVKAPWWLELVKRESGAMERQWNPGRLRDESLHKLKNRKGRRRRGKPRWGDTRFTWFITFRILKLTKLRSASEPGSQEEVSGGTSEQICVGSVARPAGWLRCWTTA